MAQLLNGSLCVTDLIDKFKAGHSAFTRGKNNGKVYVNITEWINEEADQFGNHASFKLNSSKDGKEKDKAANGGKDVYIGHAKLVDPLGGEPIKAGSKEFDGANVSAIPANATSSPAEPDENLPF